MIDFGSFAQFVHDAFGHLYDRAYLEDHPLARLLFADGPPRAERLHRTLIDSLEWLRPLGGGSPHHAEWRRYRHLQLRHVDGDSPEQIAKELFVSGRQARRDHAEALDELARLLWERFIPTENLLPTPALEDSSATMTRPGDLESELSKMSAGARPTITQIDEVLSGVIETVGPLARGNNVTIDCVVDPELPPIAASRPVLRQLLLSVLADAIGRHPVSSLEIRVCRSTESVDLVVRTASTGRADCDLISTACLDLAGRLGRSQSVVVQFASTSGQRDANLAVILTLPLPSALSVLLVDDNPDVGLLFRRYLTDTGFRLIQARSADRALHLAREIRPVVVVLDVLLPSTDGWEILQALRADPSTRGIPVILSSVLPDHAIARSLGVSEFLPKPVTREALLRALSRFDRDSERAPVPAPLGASG